MTHRTSIDPQASPEPARSRPASAATGRLTPEQRAGARTLLFIAVLLIVVASTIATVLFDGPIAYLAAFTALAMMGFLGIPFWLVMVHEAAESAAARARPRP